jgi:hypothetical protein
MTPPDCPEVRDRLDLYAAGECEPAEAEAVRRHLAHCPRCAAAFEEAGQFLALLELRLQEPERLQRLEARIAAEAAPRRRVVRFPAALRRVAALAAMLLLMAVTIGWLTQGLRPAEDGGGLAVVLREGPAHGGDEELQGPAAIARAVPKETPRHYRADAEAPGRLPPPAVDLVLTLRNTTHRPMRVWVAGPQTELRLDLRGPGAVSVPVQGSAGQEPRAVTLRPGEEYAIPITSLRDGRRAWYWTEPGDYTLTAQFTTRGATLEGGQRRVTARGGPVTVHVEGN